MKSRNERDRAVTGRACRQEAVRRHSLYAYRPDSTFEYMPMRLQD